MRAPVTERAVGPQVLDRQAEILGRRTERALRDELERIESVEREAGVPLSFKAKMDIQRRLQLIELKAAKQERERADRARQRDSLPAAAAGSQHSPSSAPPAHEGASGDRMAGHFR
jgi:hypothetical protein